ncbi:MAG: double zinc ribbon domain-containing protein [Thermodesulfobacteriota bacterium]
MVGYKHPCRYCDGLIPPDSEVCPLCGRVNPTGPFRCPKCRSPIQRGWKNCSDCGLSLELVCPHCGKNTFFGDYCDHCNEVLRIICKHCKTSQAPIGDRCIKCNKPLK